MDDNTLDSLVVLYQKGDETALEIICKEFIPIITSMSEKVWYKLKNNAEFECRCILKIKRALQNFDSAKGKARNLIISVITKERSDFLKYKRGGRCQVNISLSTLSKEDDEGNLMEFEIIDDLAVVEENIINECSLNEKIAKLAQGDSIKLAILNAWKDGIYNDSKLSEMLAHSFNGNQESYRKYIQRFRKKCAKVLS